jgi:hypothetical protein
VLALFAGLHYVAASVVTAGMDGAGGIVGGGEGLGSVPGAAMNQAYIFPFRGIYLPAVLESWLGLRLFLVSPSSNNSTQNQSPPTGLDWSLDNR